MYNVYEYTVEVSEVKSNAQLCMSCKKKLIAKKNYETMCVNGCEWEHKPATIVNGFLLLFWVGLVEIKN